MSTNTSVKPNPEKGESKTVIGKTAAKVDGVKAESKGSKAEPKLEPVAESKEVKPVVSTTPKAQSQTPTPAPETKKPLTLVNLQEELKLLTQTVQDHAQLIDDLQEQLSRKRRPTSNGKIQIRDKQTGKIYPSKNNAYQSLLKSGELKELTDKGVFGSEPARNTFGWYALVRALPDRFEEVKKEVEEKTDDNGKTSGNDKSMPESQ